MPYHWFLKIQNKTLSVWYNSTWTHRNIAATETERPHDNRFMGNGIFLLNVSKTGPVKKMHRRLTQIRQIKYYNSLCFYKEQEVTTEEDWELPSLLTLIGNPADLHCTVQNLFTKSTTLYGIKRQKYLFRNAREIMTHIECKRKQIGKKVTQYWIGS